MVCEAAVKEVERRLPRYLQRIGGDALKARLDGANLDLISLNLFRDINWWTRPTIREALTEVLRRKINGPAQ